MHKREIAAADDPEAERDRLAAEYADEQRVRRRRGARGLHRRARRAARHAPPARRARSPALSLSGEHGNAGGNIPL